MYFIAVFLSDSFKKNWTQWWGFQALCQHRKKCLYKEDFLAHLKTLQLNLICLTACILTQDQFMLHRARDKLHYLMDKTTLLLGNCLDKGSMKCSLQITYLSVILGLLNYF